MLSGNCKTSQVCNQYLDFSPFFQTPAVSPRSRSNERFLLAATIMRVSPTALLGLTTLNHFKLSPYGSKSFLPTLNTHLTDLCPRLDTDSLLRFIGSGVSPDYIDCTELAHHNKPSFPSTHCKLYRISVIFYLFKLFTQSKHDLIISHRHNLSSRQSRQLFR